MTLAQFTEIFALLAVQMRFNDADEATIRGYYKALSGLEPELVAMAAHRFAQGVSVNENYEAWFPKAPEWRAMTVKIEKERTDELTARLRHLPVQCAACDDTGWAPSGQGVVKCECRKLRRLEILGRRPMPALPPHQSASDPSQQAEVEKMAAKNVRVMR